MSLEAGCSYGLAPRRESIASHAGLAAPPKAIHLRLSEETLSKLVTQTNNNKKGKGRALDEEPFMAYDSNTSVPTLRIGDTLHQLMAVKEDQPHEIYKRSASAPDILELVGRITERLMVKQELDADMQDRVRVRSEAAVAERSERHIVVLETDPTAKKGKPPISRMSIHARAASPLRNATTARPLESPKTSPKPRAPSRLVADHVVKPRQISPSPLSVTEKANLNLERSEDNITATPQDILVVKKECIDEMALDSASSTGETSRFSFSTVSNTSSNTSTSSGESPPSKDFLTIDISKAPSIAVLSATPVTESQNISGLGIAVSSTPVPGYSPENEVSNDVMMADIASQDEAEASDEPLAKRALPTHIKSPSSSPTSKSTSLAAPLPEKKRRRQHQISSKPHPLLPPPPAALPNKRSNGEAAQFNSVGDASDLSKVQHGPKAHARTAGGARISRPVSKSSPNATPRSSPAPSSAAISRPSTPQPAPTSSPWMNGSLTPDLSVGRSASSVKKRKAADEESDGMSNKKKRGSPKFMKAKDIHFTSSEDEAGSSTIAKVHLGNKKGPATLAVNSKRKASASDEESSARGRAVVSKPLRTAVTTLKSEELGTSRSPTQSRASSETRPAVLSSQVSTSQIQLARTLSSSSSSSTSSLPRRVTISSEEDYKQHHSRFNLLHVQYETMRANLVKAKATLEAMIAGHEVSDADRLNVPSKKEGEKLTAKAEETRSDLVALKQALWEYAKSRARSKPSSH